MPFISGREDRQVGDGDLRHLFLLLELLQVFEPGRGQTVPLQRAGWFTRNGPFDETRSEGRPQVVFTEIRAMPDFQRVPQVVW